MRWSTFLAEGQARTGIWHEETIEERDPPSNLSQYMLAGGQGRGSLPGRTHGKAMVELRSPIAHPPSIRDFVAFEQHLTNGGGGKTPPPEWYEMPVFYFSNPAAVVGPYDQVPISPGSKAFDYELEVAAVIGVAGADIPVEQADEHVFGFMIMCDFSARDLQAKEGKVGLGPSKGKDSATSFGPWIATADELVGTPSGHGNSYDLTMTATVNERLYSTGRLSEMYWTFAQLIAYASRGTTLLPGDIIGSGTVGTGCILEHRMLGRKADYPWLRDGDVLQLAVEGLGTVQHVIGPASDPLPLWPDRDA